MKRLLAAVIVAVLAFGWGPEGVWGQCAMCGKNAEAAGGAAGSIGPLVLAAVVLLVPSLCVLGVFAVLTWKLRGADGRYRRAASAVEG